MAENLIDVIDGLRGVTESIRKSIERWPAGAPDKKGGQFAPGNVSGGGSRSEVPAPPQFKTSNAKVKAMNEAAASNLHAMAQAGDVAGIKGFTDGIDKSPKLAAYRTQLLQTLGGDAKPAAPKEKPAAAKAPKEAIGELKASIQSLIDIGVTLGFEKKAMSDHEFGTIVVAAAKELTRLNDQFPNIAKGLQIMQRYPGKGALGVNYKNSMIAIVPPAKHKHSAVATAGDGIHWSTSATGGWSATLRHELGHAIDYGTKQQFRDMLKKTTFEMNGKQVDTATWAKANISKYSGTNTSEALAEMFAKYTAADYKKGSMPQSVETIMHGLATAGGVKK